MTDDKSVYEKAEAGELSDEEAQAHNEQRLEEIRERTEHLNEQERDAIDALRKDAQESLEIGTVELPSGAELEVRSRVPPAVERLHGDMQAARESGDIDRARRLGCEMLAEMCVTDGYDNPDVWLTASRDGNAGMQWLAEVTDIMVKPAAENAEGLEGNSKASGDSQNPTGDNQSGWQRQR